MASVFTRIIEGALPGRFVWRDDDVVAFLTIAPITPGHTLVVPVAEIDHWIDLPAELLSRVAEVAQIVGRAIDRAFSPTKVGMMIAGLEVPHTHLHVLPIHTEADLSFAKARPDTPAEELDAAQAAIRAALEELGYEPA
ncbi:MAG TPA: HIT family protein [Actinobacteria bacterium]|nr:HIT family protein [Actinomycetota bacterium]